MRLAKYEVEQGAVILPLHFHHANEELLFVLSGTPTLRRGPDDERTLQAGEVVSFLPGRSGVHQIVNRAAEPARVLIAATNDVPEVAEQVEDQQLAIITTTACACRRSATPSPPDERVSAAVHSTARRGRPAGLDRLARDRGASKREIVTRLILDKDLTVGHPAFHPATEPAVLTPREAAELLQIDEQLVLELAATGQLPARRLGDQWRFSRNALLDWLDPANGTDQPQ